MAMQGGLPKLENPNFARDGRCEQNRGVLPRNLQDPLKYQQTKPKERVEDSS
jgi:hypothetical protein